MKTEPDSSASDAKRGYSCAWISRSWLVVVAATLMLSGRGLTPQEPYHAPHPILLPQANNLPDVNTQMLMKQKQVKKDNFEAANALRSKQIADETAKLLILAQDLKLQMDKLGNEPLPDRVLKEATVIELLAHDVQTKMTLTVGGS